MKREDNLITWNLITEGYQISQKLQVIIKIAKTSVHLSANFAYCLQTSIETINEIGDHKSEE